MPATQSGRTVGWRKEVGGGGGGGGLKRGRGFHQLSSRKIMKFSAVSTG